jgi:hypothetical protein
MVAVAISIPSGADSLGDQAFGENPKKIPKGAMVTWTNNDTLAHTVTSTEAGLFDSGTIAPGGTFTHTFNEAGSFAYSCAIHPSMTGVIQVDGSEPGASPTPETSASPGGAPGTVGTGDDESD